MDQFRVKVARLVVKMAYQKLDGFAEEAFASKMAAALHPGLRAMKSRLPGARSAVSELNPFSPHLGGTSAYNPRSYPAPAPSPSPIVLRQPPQTAAGAAAAARRKAEMAMLENRLMAAR